MENLKQIRLVADKPFYNNVDLAICDFGGPDGSLRVRGRITVDYGEYDINQLKGQGVDTLEKALAYYKDMIYKTVRRYLLTDFQLVAAPGDAGYKANAAGNTGTADHDDDGWPEILHIIAGQIKGYYE
jgi:hypothetical protein